MSKYKLVITVEVPLMPSDKKLAKEEALMIQNGSMEYWAVEDFVKCHSGTFVAEIKSV